MIFANLTDRTHKPANSYMGTHGMSSQKRKQTDLFLDEPPGKVFVVGKQQNAIDTRMLDMCIHDNLMKPSLVHKCLLRCSWCRIDHETFFIMMSVMWQAKIIMHRLWGLSACPKKRNVACMDGVRGVSCNHNNTSCGNGLNMFLCNKSLKYFPFCFTLIMYSLNA